MRKLLAFNHVSLDGYFCTPAGDMSWAHSNDPEWTAFVAGNASGNGALLFGRITYDMMASFWPTPAARQMAPVVAEGMNRMPKYVVSKSLGKVSWSNTTLLHGDLAEEVNGLKATEGPDIVILGSGSIVAQLSRQRLIDEYQMVIRPVVIGAGRTMFEGLPSPMLLKRTNARTFSNGNVVIYYEPCS